MNDQSGVDEKHEKSVLQEKYSGIRGGGFDHEQLFDKLDAMRKMADILAHDFNNILTLVQGYSDLASMQPELSDQTKAIIGKIKMSVEKGTQMTARILSFSRNKSVDMEPFDLNGEVSALAGRLKSEISESISMHAVLCPKPLYINANKGLFEQLIHEILQNAIESMPYGGSISIITDEADLINEGTVSAKDKDLRYALIRISDQGIGISEDRIGHILEPFHTTKTGQKGAGLGLSVAYRIVRLHKGRIELFSEQGKGTTVELFFPRAG